MARVLSYNFLLKILRKLKEEGQDFYYILDSPPELYDDQDLEELESPDHDSAYDYHDCTNSCTAECPYKNLSQNDQLP